MAFPTGRCRTSVAMGVTAAVVVLVLPGVCGAFLPVANARERLPEEGDEQKQLQA